MAHLCTHCGTPMEAGASCLEDLDPTIVLVADRDCPDCNVAPGATPCCCGHEYQRLGPARRLEIARAALPPGYKVVRVPTKKPSTKGSTPRPRP